MFGLNPWVLLGVVLAFGTTNAGSYWYGTTVGAEGERVEWQAWANIQLTAANKRILELTESARALESLHAVRLASISTKYQEELQNEKANADRVIADLRNGGRKLRIPITSSGAACRSEASPTAASSGGRDGETRADIHPAASEFLVRLTSEADAIVRQLTACQSVIVQDRNNAERQD